MALLTKLPNLPSPDVKSAWARLHERALKPTGESYPVFNPIGPDQFPAFVAALRSDHDALDETRVFANDLKKNVDAHAATLASLPAADAELQKTLEEARDALEALKARPF